MQFYSANYLGASAEGAGVDAPNVTGKGGASYGLNNAFCLETQNFPDAVNQGEGFPNAIVQVREHSHYLAVERCTEDRHVVISPAMLRSSNGFPNAIVQPGEVYR